MTSGLYTYTVDLNTDPAAGSTTLRITGTGALSTTALFIDSMAASQTLSWFSELDNVTQRLGELHFDKRDARSGLSTWLRGHAQQYDFNDKLTGTPFGERHYATQAGFDYKLGDDTPHNIYLGAHLGYGQAQRNLGSTGDARSDSLSGGLYLTISTPDGWYLDALAKINRFENRFNAHSPTGERATARYTNTALGASLELGKHHKLGYNMYFEPQIQGAVTTLTGAAYATVNYGGDGTPAPENVSVNTLPGTTYRARTGFRLGRSIEIGASGMLSVYVKGYYSRQWTVNNRVHARTTGGQTGRFTTKIEGETLTGGLGVAWRLTEKLQLHLDADTSQAYYYIKPWSINFGARYMW
jgi:outer membrane autotransporter protein